MYHMLFEYVHFLHSPDISEEQLKENFGKVMVGEHERKKLDKDFRDDPEKQAKLSEIRGTSAAEGIPSFFNVENNLYTNNSFCEVQWDFKKIYIFHLLPKVNLLVRSSKAEICY